MTLQSSRRCPRAFVSLFGKNGLYTVLIQWSLTHMKLAWTKRYIGGISPNACGGGNPTFGWFLPKARASKKSSRNGGQTSERYIFFLPQRSQLANENFLGQEKKPRSSAVKHTLNPTFCIRICWRCHWSNFPPDSRNSRAEASCPQLRVRLEASSQASSQASSET